MSSVYRHKKLAQLGALVPYGVPHRVYMARVNWIKRKEKYPEYDGYSEQGLLRRSATIKRTCAKMHAIPRTHHV